MMKPFHGLIDHFRIATHVSKHGPRNEPHQLPGFQLLATCKQAYSEGYELFYAMNTFFLPPGWTEHTHGHLIKTIHWKHKNLISSVGLIIGLEDLTPSIFSDIRENVQHVERFLHGGRNALSGRHLAMFWGIAVGLKLSDIWMEKLALLKYLGGLESVKLVTVYQEIVVAADNVLDPQGGLGIKHYSPEIRVMLKQARKIVRRAVARKVDQDGWKSLQEWVKRGCKA